MEEIAWGIDTVLFAVIAGVGFMTLLATFLFGEVADFAHHDLGIGVGEGEVPAPSFLNTQTALAFITGFGATAWVLSGYFHVQPLLSTLFALLGGVPVAGAVALLTRALGQQAATSSFRLDDMVNETATVTSRIPSNGLGQVTYQKSGATYTALARSQEGNEIPEGTPVVIERVAGTEVSVRKSE